MENEIQQSHWMRVINWTHGLLDGCPRPKSGKTHMAPFCGGKSIGKKRARDLKNQDATHGPTQGFDVLQMSPTWRFLGIWTLDSI